ncbi:MAG: transglycosylase SLT domain-containing protein [Zoogloeaceae bacterium]|jgi:membrane-bound lytic murein transglycosylase D|nr:transglycosylase SLT domain-containing protein [Zoogloeaceae bacterium]
MLKFKFTLAEALACAALYLFAAAAAGADAPDTPDAPDAALQPSLQLSWPDHAPDRAPDRVPDSVPDNTANQAPDRVPTVELETDPPPVATIDLTLPEDDLWARIRNGFGMPDLDSPLVQQQQAWYLARPAYLQRVVERSRRYMHYIVEELEKRGMPTELALLPIVESAYNPMAYSRAHASGMWQFIPATGKTYRLDQNWWMDERRDIIASTGAALEYLQSIYDMHGDWHLALASYNWGEHAVARAIEKNKAKGLPTDYPSLSMPKETQGYVPKLQALKNIIAQPELFNIRLDPIPNKPYFETVEVPAHMDVAIAARLAEMTMEEFLALNPAFNRPVIPADKHGVNIVLPAEKIDIFLANLEAHDKPLTNWQAYTIKKGETLEAVAKKHGLSVARLKQVNGINRKMRIRPGHTLLVPAKSGATDTAADNLLSVNLPVVTPTVKPAPSKKKSGRRGKKASAKKGNAKTQKQSAVAK